MKVLEILSFGRRCLLCAIMPMLSIALAAAKTSPARSCFMDNADKFCWRSGTPGAYNLYAQATGRAADADKVAENGAEDDDDDDDGYDYDRLPPLYDDYEVSRISAKRLANPIALCGAETRWLYYEGEYKIDQARLLRLQQCMSKQPPDIALLIQEAYYCAKRHAESFSCFNLEVTGTGLSVAILGRVSSICAGAIDLIELICTQETEAIRQLPVQKEGLCESLPATSAVFRKYDECDEVRAAFEALCARLHPTLPSAELWGHLAATLSPSSYAENNERLLVEYCKSEWLRVCKWPMEVEQDWSPDNSDFYDQYEELERLEAAALKGDAESLQRVLDMLLFKTRSYGTCIPKWAQEIYWKVKARYPDLKLEKEDKVQLALYFSTARPLSWTGGVTRDLYSALDLDLCGDGKPGYLLSLAWHYAHNEVCVWRTLLQILSRSGGGVEALSANLLQAYFHENGDCDPQYKSYFVEGTGGIDFNSPLEVSRYLTYHDRKRRHLCAKLDVYDLGAKFIALHVANELQREGPCWRMRLAERENALRQYLAIELRLIDDGLFIAIPVNQRKLWEEYFDLLEQIKLAIATGNSDKSLPDAAAFAATQAAWLDFFQICVAETKGASGMMTCNARRAWLLEKRVVQLRRLLWRFK